MTQPHDPDPNKDSSSGIEHAYDLKFVPTYVNDHACGGWYRELTGGQIEVMTRALMECVPIEDADPETKARAVIEKLIKQQNT